MKTQETVIKILSKETKTGTNNGQDWSIDEYTVVESIEQDNGGVSETKVKASATKALGELEVGALYNAVLFITSRETEKDGKKYLWNSFRITRADKISDAEPKAEEKKDVGKLDAWPF